MRFTYHIIFSIDLICSMKSPWNFVGKDCLGCLTKSLCPCEGHWVGCIFRSALRWNRNWEPILSNPTDVDYGISDLIGLLCECSGIKCSGITSYVFSSRMPHSISNLFGLQLPGNEAGSLFAPTWHHMTLNQDTSQNQWSIFCLPSAI